jgi:hypothetical protein
MAEFRKGTPFLPDNLIAGEFPRVAKTVTIAQSAALSRGAVLGKITASGKFVLSEADAEDGSETPRAILAEDVDATAADVQATVYLTGEFSTNAITLGDGHTVDSVYWALADVGIFLTPTTGA